MAEQAQSTTDRPQKCEGKPLCDRFTQEPACLETWILVGEPGDVVPVPPHDPYASTSYRWTIG